MKVLLEESRVPNTLEDRLNVVNAFLSQPGFKDEDGLGLDGGMVFGKGCMALPVATTVVSALVLSS